MNNSIGIINDLLQIQHDRALAYEKMLKYNNQDETMSAFLRKITVQSRNSILELRAQMTDISRSEPADRVRIKGGIYPGWPGIKAVLPESNPDELLLSLECNEETTVSAYQKALGSGEVLCKELQILIYNQLNRIRESFIFIRAHKEKPLAPETVNERKPWGIVSEERFALSEF